MKSVRKKAVGAAVAVAAAAGIAVSGPVLAGVNTSPAPAVQQGSTNAKAAPVAAADNPYGPAEVCGSGFRIVDDPGGINNKAKRPLVWQRSIFGYVYLLYNNSTGQNCVVTIKSRFVGTKTYTSANLEVQLDGPHTRIYGDNGNYAYYAGPVKANAAGKCVAYWGKINDGNDHIAHGGRYSFGNCG